MKVRGRVVEFNTTTWWGRASYDLSVVDFHGTTVNGMRMGVDLVGKTVDLLFNDDGNLYDVRVVE